MGLNRLVYIKTMKNSDDLSRENAYVCDTQVIVEYDSNSIIASSSKYYDIVIAEHVW